MLVFGILSQTMLIVLALTASVLLTGRSLAAKVILLAGVGILIAGVIISGIWVYPPFWFVPVFVIVFLVTARRHFRLNKSSALPRPSVITLPVGAVFGAVGMVLLWQSWMGRQPPAIRTIDLAAPLATDSNICVISGGNSLLLNLHFLLKGHPTAQSEVHSVDFIQTNVTGFRTISNSMWNPKPFAPEAYEIFGETVVAPCFGTVRSMENNRRDLPASSAHRDDGGSNYVALSCGDVIVVMAHLKRGSVKVAVGETVEIGAPIGRVGNSGNTEEPHLHINAQTDTGKDDLYLGSDPIAMTFDDRYLYRGQCL